MVSSLNALLVQDRVVGFRQMDAAVRFARENDLRLETALLQMGLVGESLLMTYLSRLHGGVPAMEATAVQAIERRAFELLPASEMRRWLVFAWHRGPSALALAAVEPPSSDVLRQLAQQTGMEPEITLIHELRFFQVLHALLGEPVPARLADLVSRLDNPPGFAPEPAPVVLPEPTALEDAPTPPPVASPVHHEGPWRQGELAASFDAPTDRDFVLYSALRLLERVVPRRAILVVARAQLRAFDGEGFSLAPGQASSFSLALREDSLLARALRGDGPVVGSPSELSLTSWYNFTGQAQPSHVCIAPIAIQGRTALLILADPGTHALDHGVVPWIAVLARRTSTALAGLIATQKRSRNTVATGAVPVVSQPAPSSAVVPPLANENGATPEAPMPVVAESRQGLPPAETAEPSLAPADAHLALASDAIAAENARVMEDPFGTLGAELAAALPDTRREAEKETATRVVEDSEFVSLWSIDHASGREGQPATVDPESSEPVSSEFDDSQITEVSLQVGRGLEEHSAPVSAEKPVPAPVEEAISVASSDPAVVVQGVAAEASAPKVKSPPSAELSNPTAHDSFAEFANADRESDVATDDSMFDVANLSQNRKQITDFPVVVDSSSEFPASGRTAGVIMPTLMNAHLTLVPVDQQGHSHGSARRYKPGESIFSNSALDALDGSDPGAPVSGFPGLDPAVAPDGDLWPARAIDSSSDAASDVNVPIWTVSQTGQESAIPDHPVIQLPVLDEDPEAAAAVGPRQPTVARAHAIPPVPSSALPASPNPPYQPSPAVVHPRTSGTSSVARPTPAPAPRRDDSNIPHGIAVPSAGRQHAHTDQISPVAQLVNGSIPRIINDSPQRPSPQVGSTTLLQPPSQNTMHAPPSELAPPINPDIPSRAQISGNHRALGSHLHTPIFLDAAADMPAAAGGLLPGDPGLRAHASRLPDAQVMELLSSGEATYREVAFAVLVERGAAAQQALLSSFPRPLNGHRRELVAAGAPLEEHGPVIWLVSVQLRFFVEPLRHFLTHSDSDHRYYATVLLARANDPSCLDKVAELLYDVDDQVRVAAMRYVETWRQNDAIDSVLAVVRRHFAAGDPRNMAISAAAAAELRDVTAVPILIELLDHPSEPLRRRAQISLVRLTFQEIGGDRRAWEKWLRKAPGARRDRWLLDAMVDKDIRVRENAAREIRSIPRLVVNYNPEFDLRGQQTAQRTVEHFLTLRRGQF
jgi:hypothetical protein